MPDSVSPGQRRAGEERGPQRRDQAEAEHHQVEQDRGRQPGLAAGERAAAGLRGEPGEPPAAQRDQYDGEHRRARAAPAGGTPRAGSARRWSARSGPSSLASSRRAAAPSRRMPSRRSSRVIRAGSTACTRTPRAARSRTRSGTAVPSSSAGSATVNQSPARSTFPVAASRACAAGGHVGQVQPQLALAEQLGERAGCGDPAAVEDDDPVADPLDLADQVRVEQHRDAARLQRQHDVAHVGAAERVQRAGRLVQDDQLRPGHQGDRQPEALLHPLGEAAHAGRRRVRPGRRGPGSPAAPPRSRRSRTAGRAGRAPRPRSATAGTGRAPAGSRRGPARPGRRRAGRAASPRRRPGAPGRAAS